MRKALSLTAAVVALAATSSLAYAATQDAPALATPVGVTLKSVRIGQGVNVPGSSSNQPRERLVFADDKGQTLYQSDKDPAGKSACDATCAKDWPPLLAPADAKAAGDWSLVAREDGAKQWAFRGKPLYTSMKDAPKAGGPGGGGGMGFGGGGVAGHGVDGHSIYEIMPSEWMTLPAGVTVSEVLTAPGQALTTLKGLSLYAFDGDAKKDKGLGDSWAPFTAPQIAIPTGDFTVVARDDGRYQWAYKGKALYTFKGDLELGDSNGKDVDKRLQLATVMRYYMPSEVAIKKDERRGGVLISAADGKALYARDRASYGGTGGHNARGGARGNPGTGQSIGLSGCDTECEKIWVPLKAPTEAKPAGYWSVFTRADGSKQWAYQGYALYTYAKEKAGDITGHDTYDLVVNHDTEHLAAANMGMGLYWRVETP